MGTGNDGTGNIAERDDWHTPQWLFDILDAQYEFTFDCCADVHNRKCKNWHDDFLKVENEEAGFDDEDVCWMNPPFTKAKVMFEHFFEVVPCGVCIYRCDNMETKIWQHILKNATWILMPNGRIHYEGKSGKGSRFPSALIGFNVETPEGIEGTTLIIKHRTSC